MTTRGALVYFTDENTLGLGKLLRRSGRDDILYPGHEDLPEIPLGAHEHGIRSVWLGAKRDLRPTDQVDLFLRHETRLQREITKRGPGPWALTMSLNGLRPLPLRPRPDEVG